MKSTIELGGCGKINSLDYYKNPVILSAIHANMKYIKNQHDKEDCQQEIFAELYSFMPLEEDAAIKLVNRVSSRFKYHERKIYKHEISLEDAGIE